MTDAGWMCERPTVAGWYWWRQEKGMLEVPREVSYSPYFKELRSQCEPVGACGGEWLGPLSPTDRQQGKVEGIQESKNLVSEFIEAWLLAGMVAKLLTPAVHEAVGGLSRDLRRELQKIEQAAQDEKGVGDGKDCL